jgi:hypothetical protein
MFEFRYRHSLSRPLDTALDKGVYELTRLQVEADAILMYGMMEGNPNVCGHWVVYDPQSHYGAVPFRQSGSVAEHLAIVANRSEAQKLSGGESDINKAGEKLLEDAEVVIIKNGPHGAYVFTRDRAVHRVPAYKTKRTFLIGSGDVFSAAFAFAWMIERRTPEEAADIAAKATAFYCQSATVPVPAVLPAGFHEGEVIVGRSPRIYLAGPFFSLQQVWMIEEALTCLTQQGATVFSPYHDVGFGPTTLVAQADIDAIEDCDSIFALLEDHDPGTIFEIGYARARGKPVVAFAPSTDPVHVTMFAGSGCKLFDDFVTAIYAAIWA